MTQITAALKYTFHSLEVVQVHAWCALMYIYYFFQAAEETADIYFDFNLCTNYAEWGLLVVQLSKYASVI